MSIKRLDAHPFLALVRRASVAKLVAVGMTFAFSLVVGRTTGPQGAGVVYAAVVGASALGILGRFGTEYAVLRDASAASETGGLSRESMNWRYLFSLGVLLSILSSSVALSALCLLPAGLNRTAYMTFAVSIPFQTVGVLCSSLLRAAGRAGLGAFAEVGLAQGIAATVIVLWQVVAEVNVVVAGVAFSGAWALVCVWSLAAVGRTWRPREEDLRLPRPRLGSLGAMMSSSLLFYLLTWSPVGVLLVVATQTDVAWFGAAARFPTLIALIPTVQLTAALPVIAAHIAHRRVAEANLEIRAINARAAVIAVATGAALVATGPWVMGLFGPGFAGAATTLTVLVIGQVGAVLLGPAATLPLVAGYERHTMIVLCATVPVAIACSALLAMRWGSVGAAAGWAFSICAFGIAVAVILRRGMGLNSYLTIRRSRRRPTTMEQQ